MWSKCPRAQPFWYLGATLLPSSLHMLAGIPFELGLGAICFAMTLVLTIPIYGIHLAIRSGGRSARALVRKQGPPRFLFGQNGAEQASTAPEGARGGI